MPLLTSPAQLLAKALQHLEVQPDLSAPPRLGLPQSLERLHWEPSLHAEDHDFMEPSAGGVEPGLEVGLRGLGFGRLRAGTARAPSAKTSSCRGLWFFMAAP
jgi:hypothetical protein